MKKIINIKLVKNIKSTLNKIYNSPFIQKFKGEVIEISKKQSISVAVAILLASGLSAYAIHGNWTRQEAPVISITDNQAEELYYEGRYEEAISEYLDIFSKENDEPIWYVKIAEIYSVQGDIENSKKYINLAKELRQKNISENKEILEEDYSTKDAEVLNGIVFTEVMNKEYSLALKDGEEALEKYPKNKNIMKTMLNVYMANGMYEEARTLIAFYPTDRKSAYDIAEHARMTMLLNQWNEGLEELKEAWIIDKDEYKIFDILAQISAYNKNLLLQKISDLSNNSPEDPTYKIWLAKIYSMREETAELAQKYLDEASLKDVGKIEKVLIQSDIYRNSKKEEEADNLITELIGTYNDDYRVLHTAGWHYLQKKDYETALYYCKKSILKNKEYTDNYGFLMPEILKAMGKTVEGEPYFRTALLKEPYNYNIMLTLAGFYYANSDINRSMEYFKSAETVKPDDAEIKYNIAMINLSNNQEDEAIKILTKCIELDNSVPKYHRTLGTIYMTNEKYSEGIKEIRNAYEVDKEDILTLNNAGCYYITAEGYLDRGVYNLQKAYEGITTSTDEDTKKTITENYEKAKKLLDDYNSGKGNESLKIPEFILFY